MRLRRETGDFQIKVTPGEAAGSYVVNSIRPGLSAEDLIGEVVDTGNGSFTVIVATSVDSENGKITAVTYVSSSILSKITLVYDPATGSIAYNMPSTSPITPGNPTA